MNRYFRSANVQNIAKMAKDPTRPRFQDHGMQPGSRDFCVWIVWQWNNKYVILGALERFRNSLIHKKNSANYDS